MLNIMIYDLGLDFVFTSTWDVNNTNVSVIGPIHSTHRVTDRLGGRKLGLIRNNGGFCAAGENFSKNDQDQ